MKLKQCVGMLLLLLPGLIGAQQPAGRAVNPNPYILRPSAGEASRFGEVQAEDVIFQKTIWRMLDMEEDMNSPFFYPTQAAAGRQNLISALLEEVRQGKLTAYQPAALGSELQPDLKMTWAQVEQSLGALHDSIAVLDENGNRVWVIRQQESQMEEIQKVLVKEMMYFDKRNARMQTRVIALCPIRMIPKESYDEGEADLIPQQTFWIAYAEARDFLANQYVTTGFNEARNMSFDAYLAQRRYRGPIYAISNAKGNQRLADYVSEAEIQQESDRLEAQLAEFEQKLWQ